MLGQYLLNSLESPSQDIVPLGTQMADNALPSLARIISEPAQSAEIIMDTAEINAEQSMEEYFFKKVSFLYFVLSEIISRLSFSASSLGISKTSGAGEM